MKLTGRFFLVLMLLFAPVAGMAEEIQWRPVRSSAAGKGGRAPATPYSAPARLLRPVPLAPALTQAGADSQVRQASFTEGNERPSYLILSPRTDSEIRQTSLWNVNNIMANPISGDLIRRQATQGVPAVPPPPVPGTAGIGKEPYNCAVPPDPIAPPVPGPMTGVPQQGGVMGFVNSIIAPPAGRKVLQSDHAFDSFISPMTNPFFFEDPRSLTEIRPIYMYQPTPNSNPIFAGGNINVFALQGRVAVTERLSFVIQKLGWLWFDVNNPMGQFQTNSGFTELWLGPKYTFIRDEVSKTLLAGGLTFEIPVGSGSIFQNTGSLSLRPYLSFGQEFLQTSYGRFHFLNTTGYDFAVDGKRSQFFFSSFHLDYDVLNWQRIYPFVELNWFAYTVNGNVQNLNFEGRDLINFGSQHVSGNNDLVIATGARYKITPHIILGAAVSFPLLNNKDLLAFRATFDAIFRY